MNAFKIQLNACKIVLNGIKMSLKGCKIVLNAFKMLSNECKMSSNACKRLLNSFKIVLNGCKSLLNAFKMLSNAFLTKKVPPADLLRHNHYRHKTIDPVTFGHRINKMRQMLFSLYQQWRYCHFVPIN